MSPAVVAIVSRMAAALLPVCLSLPEGDRYTLWAPRWRDAGDEWEAFLGSDDALFAFDTVADLVAFVRADSDNDVQDHPAWATMTAAGAHAFTPTDDHRFDLVAVEELVAEKPTEASVAAIAATLSIVSSLGAVCELPAVSKFFNGNPALATVSGGIAHFTGRAGRKRWHVLAEIIGRNWDGVLTAIDEIVTTPEVDENAVARAVEELAEEPPEPQTAESADASESTDGDEVDGADDEADSDADDAGDDDGPDDEQATDGHVRADGDTVVLGGAEDFWEQVGIDPIRIMTSSGTFYTLRCYIDDAPLFLGRNGRISVFPSERALARYLADEHDHDLSDLSTYDDIRTAATDGSLTVDVSDDNVYVLTGLADDFTDGPTGVDRDHLELVVELLRDIGDYSEETTVDTALAPDQPLGALVAAVLEPGSVEEPGAPYSAAVREWEKLEKFVSSRLRRE